MFRDYIGEALDRFKACIIAVVAKCWLYR